MKYPDKGFQWIGKCNIDKRAEAVVCSKKATKKEKASEYLRIMLSVEDVPSAEIIRRMDRIGIKEGFLIIYKNQRLFFMPKSCF